MPSLQRTFIGVLVALFLILVSSQALVSYQQRDNLDGETIIRLTGDLRSLSQDMSKDLLAHYVDEGLAEEYEETLEELEEFQAIYGEIRLLLPVQYRDNFDATQAKYDQIVGSVTCFIALQDGGDTTNCSEDARSYLVLLLEVDEDFLEAFDEIAAELNQIANDEEAFGNNLQTLASAAVIAGLIGMGWFVIRPTAQRIERNQAELQARDDALQAQNVKLMNANRDLAVARRAAESSNMMKSQFLANMSHELRTPLNAIIGYSQLLTAGMVGDLSDEQYDYQDRVLVNANHLLGLINDVLDLSKIDAGRIELANVAFSPRELLTEIVEQNHVLATAKSLTFDLDIDPNLPTPIYGDPNRLRQIVINLLSNAIKFTDTGRVTIKARRTNDTWEIIVEDTGIGIPDHLQHVIFDEFRQVHDDMGRGGTGLGLAITRKFTILMGGKIEVHSRMGEGTRFTICLPLRDETHVEADRAAIEKELA